MAHLLFQTDFGLCAIAWHESGITRFHLPEETEALTRERASRLGGVEVAESDAPPGVKRTIERVPLHLSGSPQDFSDAAIDWSLASDFQVAVYRQTLLIKAGCKSSYGEVARALSLAPNRPARWASPWPQTPGRFLSPATGWCRQGIK